MRKKWLLQRICACSFNKIEEDLEKNQPMPNSPLQQYHWSKFEHSHKTILQLSKAMNIKTSRFIRHFVIMSSYQKQQSKLSHFLDKIEFYIFLRILSSRAQIKAYFRIKQALKTCLCGLYYVFGVLLLSMLYNAIAIVLLQICTQFISKKDQAEDIQSPPPLFGWISYWIFFGILCTCISRANHHDM